VRPNFCIIVFDPIPDYPVVDRVGKRFKSLIDLFQFAPLEAGAFGLIGNNTGSILVSWDLSTPTEALHLRLRGGLQFLKPRRGREEQLTRELMCSASAQASTRGLGNVGNAILDEIVAELARGDRVELRDFGAFSVKHCLAPPGLQFAFRRPCIGGQMRFRFQPR
jgi:hypothetical protein